MTGRKFRAIVIDDEPVLVDSIRELLEMFDVDVVGVGSDGKDAVALYKQYGPDFVMLDIIMDEYDGFYAIKEIRKLDPRAKFIIMSSFDSKKAYDDLVNLGIKHVLRKPVTFEKIKLALLEFD